MLTGMNDLSRYNASVLNRVVAAMIGALIAFGCEQLVKPIEQHKVLGAAVYIVVLMAGVLLITPAVGKVRDIFDGLLARRSS